jgi:energy-converting hydrogenase Eha subunit C
MGNVPVTPVVNGNPVALVNVTLVGVPNTGVTNVGDVANTKEPEPVSSLTADAKLALVGVAKNVATPVPKPLTPVDIGNPVALVNVPDDGVPKAPPLTTNAPDEPVLTAKAVDTPVPSPDTPVEIGNPVALVNVALVGVPRIGVTKVGLVANTNEPEPVSSETALARFALVGVAKNVATPVPKPETPVLMGKPVVLVKTPLAGVPSAGAVNVGLVKVTPENVVTVAPKATLVDPIVTVLFVNAELPMLVNVFVDPLIDLFVSVSVVALPTKVSVLVGSVNVPVFVMVDITGLVNVLFVSVCVPVRVVTTLVSMAIVTALAPV